MTADSSLVKGLDFLIKVADDVNAEADTKSMPTLVR
jgi:hypothetical protein